MGPLLGRYELLMRVGTGGMATVWAARQRGSRGFQKLVALKTILPRFSSDPKYERLFLDEARLTAQVRHPNVAQILDLGEDNGVLFLAMEWIEGVSVSELLRAADECGVQIPLAVAIRIATQAAAGLHAAHELRDADGELVGLVHRDVSPQNILVSFDGITKVIDFGIAKVMRDGEDDATRSFQVRGKVGYLAPEQIMDSAIDRRVDLFALGVVLYVLTTGAHPFEGRGPLATLYNISSQSRVAPPSAFREDYPEELEAALMRCLEKDKADRFTSCDELVWTLESSIPSDLRATDQDVAVFVRSLAGNLGAQRWRALELAAAETDAFTSWTSVSESFPAPSADADEEKTSSDEDRTSGEGERTGGGEPPPPERPRPRGSVMSLLMSAAVFAFSVFTLFSTRTGGPIAGVDPPAPLAKPPLRQAVRACPPGSASAAGPQSRPGKSVLSTAESLSRRSENP